MLAPRVRNFNRSRQLNIVNFNYGDFKWLVQDYIFTDFIPYWNLSVLCAVRQIKKDIIYICIQNIIVLIHYITNINVFIIIRA